MNPEAQKAWAGAIPAAAICERMRASCPPASALPISERGLSGFAGPNFAKASPDHMAVVMIAPKVVSC